MIFCFLLAMTSYWPTTETYFCDIHGSVGQLTFKLNFTSIKKTVLYILIATISILCKKIFVENWILVVKICLKISQLQVVQKVGFFKRTVPKPLQGPKPFCWVYTLTATVNPHDLFEHATIGGRQLPIACDSVPLWIATSVLFKDFNSYDIVV